MSIWKLAYDVHDQASFSSPSLQAVVRSGSVANALQLLQRRLEHHRVKPSVKAISDISFSETQNFTFQQLVSDDWPVSLLSNALDLPARTMLVRLPDADSIKTIFYDQADLEVELQSMLADQHNSCFAVLDGACFPGLSDLLGANKIDHECLFRGDAHN